MHFLAWLFPMMEIVECTTFRVTRDADFAVSDEADDLLEAVELELRRRPFGDPVRPRVSGSCSTRMLQQLKERARRGRGAGLPVPGLLDLSELNELFSLERPDLKEDPWIPVVPARFASGDREALFAELRKSPVLVHHPYDSFARTFEWFVRTAATDPKTVAVKTSVYRTSDDSPHVPALIEAAEEGKQTVCLVELKARFDERRNIEWSRALESAGVHVVYGFPSLKIHAKGTLIVRREADGLRRYAHIGTGNYNAVTARLYEDFSLFTGRRGDHRRPGRPLQLPDRLRRPQHLPQAAGGAVHDAARAGRAHPRLCGRGRGRQAGAHPDQGQPPRRRGDRDASSTPPRTRASTSRSSPARPARSGRGGAAARKTSRCARCSAASSSTAASSSSRRTARARS